MTLLAHNFAYHDGIDHSTLLTVMVSLFALSITSPFMVLLIQVYRDRRKKDN